MNRLYIGHKKTRKAICLSKEGDNAQWREINQNLLISLNKLVLTDFAIKETDLVVFSEKDDLYHHFFQKNNNRNLVVYQLDNGVVVDVDDDDDI